MGVLPLFLGGPGGVGGLVFLGGGTHTLYRTSKYPSIRPVASFPIKVYPKTLTEPEAEPKRPVPPVHKTKTKKIHIHGISAGQDMALLK